MALTIFTQTHRESCLNEGWISPTDTDVQAYDATIDRYWQMFQTQAQEDGIDLNFEDGQGTYSYLADTDEEHTWYHQIPTFWEWYQGGDI